MLAKENDFDSVPTLSIQWKNLRGIGISFSLKLCYNSAENPSGSGLSFLGDSLLIVQFHYVLQICLGD
jgi:hypothetical protein